MDKRCRSALRFMVIVACRTSAKGAVQSCKHRFNGASKRDSLLHPCRDTVGAIVYKRIPVLSLGPPLSPPWLRTAIDSNNFR